MKERGKEQLKGTRPPKPRVGFKGVGVGAI
ncbi:hypothetical protein CCACVL1_23384 [Corchorus capsularis]|uniref:Uncharacterized protein n=1 Tax=Corchorus capsularis TaxID=210143 RepID=A0A1R3GU97_COCAP|nr:hypothetical protein CCACVL1_23384 [Corchorus capsularis]